MKDAVISIRQKDVLPKVAKNWREPGFAIEDPFNVTYDLGRGLAAEIQNFINGCSAKALRYMYLFVSYMPYSRISQIKKVFNLENGIQRHF